MFNVTHAHKYPFVTIIIHIMINTYYIHTYIHFILTYAHST